MAVQQVEPRISDPWFNAPAPRGWNPNGVLGGIKPYRLYNSLELVMSPEQLLDAGIAPGGAQDATGEIAQDGVLEGIRPAAWNAPNPNDDGKESLTINQIDPDRLVFGRPEGNYLGDYLPHGLRTPIEPLQDYPETGRGAWRSELDDQITIGVNNYNSKHGLAPGHALYLTPRLVKSWIMQESGGHRSAFETDPIQVNAPGDWTVDKAKLLGLSKGQTMTPMTSISAGLDWFFHKGAIHDSTGAITGFRSLPDTLKRYNARKSVDPNGLPHDQNYANSILDRVRNSHGGGQP